jgi:hypothetical protein
MLRSNPPNQRLCKVLEHDSMQYLIAIYPIDFVTISSLKNWLSCKSGDYILLSIPALLTQMVEWPEKHYARELLDSFLKETVNGSISGSPICILKTYSSASSFSCRYLFGSLALRSGT